MRQTRDATGSHFRAHACFHAPRRVTDLREFVEEMTKDHVFYSLVAWQPVDDQGRVVARQDSFLGSSQEEQEAALRAEMHKHARMQEGITGRITEIARRQILLEHRPQLEDFLEIATYSPFVRPGKELIFSAWGCWPAWRATTSWLCIFWSPK